MAQVTQCDIGILPHALFRCQEKINVNAYPAAVVAGSRINSGVLLALPPAAASPPEVHVVLASDTRRLSCISHHASFKKFPEFVLRIGAKGISIVVLAFFYQTSASFPVAQLLIA